MTRSEFADQMKVVAVGECTIDRFVELGTERAGGISLNFAVNARQAGADHVAVVSCIGTDTAGVTVRKKLLTAGIDTAHLHVLSGDTASQAIRLANGGERIFPPGGYNAGVLQHFRLSDADLEYLQGFDIVAVPLFTQVAHLFEPIAQARDFAGMRVVDLLDGSDLAAVPSSSQAGGGDGIDLFRIASLLDVFHVLFISGDDATAERLLPLSRDTRSVLVVTHGAMGSSALVNGVRHVAPAEPVPSQERIDTTGCGDAFQAAFTVDFFRNRDIRSALNAGARRAAVVIRHLGAT